MAIGKREVWSSGSNEAESDEYHEPISDHEAEGAKQMQEDADRRAKNAAEKQ